MTLAINYYEVIRDNEKIAEIRGLGTEFTNFITELLELKTAKVRRLTVPYAPYKITNNVALFPVLTQVCKSCKNDMVTIPKECLRIDSSNFEIVSKSRIGDYLICEKCEKEGKTSFECSLCNEFKPSDKREETIHGDPPSYLCTDCYKTVPAKLWDDKVRDLEDTHRYDFD